MKAEPKPAAKTSQAAAAEKQYFARERQQDADIHWVSHVAIEAADDQVFRRGYRDQRSPAYKNEPANRFKTGHETDRDQGCREKNLPPWLPCRNPEARHPQRQKEEDDARPAEELHGVLAISTARSFMVSSP